MATEKGFTIRLTSRYEGWWRYNTALMCGLFDAAGERIGFAAAEDRVADVEADLREKPAGVAADRYTTLATEPCDHLLLYVYVVPHTLPEGRDIEATVPFEAELRIDYDGRRIRSEKLRINQWSGTSLELRVEREGE